MGRFAMTHRVRWNETDAAGVVYFTHYLTYLEMAEVEMFRTLGVSQQEWMKREGISMPRVEAFCQYKAPARYDEVLDIQTWVEIKGKAVIIQGEIYREEKLLAKGYLKTLCVEKLPGSYGKALEPSQGLKDYLRPYIEAGG